MYRPDPPFFQTWQGVLIKRTLVGIALFVSIMVLLASLAVMWLYPRIESIDKITNYQPKLPLRIYTADNALIGEFGFEKREFVRIAEIPAHLKLAVLAIEDDRFYEHMGIDFIGIARAMLNNLLGRARQGASTITQQVARNFYLNSEQSYMRKVYEVLLAYKIESSLTKDQILELYMNQIYLGQRAYGFSAASRVYFNKPLNKISVAEAAMLAGLPKAPSAYNPVRNPKRAKQRQIYILQRMSELGYIDNKTYKTALKESLTVNTQALLDMPTTGLGAGYIAEIVRRQLVEKYGESIYGTGYNVYTTILKNDQDAAFKAVRTGLINYDTRYGYRGPEAIININSGEAYDARLQRDSQIAQALVTHPDVDNIVAAVVISSTPTKLAVVRASGEEVILDKEALKFATPWLKSANKTRFDVGSVIRVKHVRGRWQITQLPEAEAGFISINATNGAIRAMVGGFDFLRNQFNHVTQSQRQLGSSIKPFIYSAAIAKGATPQSIYFDREPNLSEVQTGGVLWEPKNYDGQSSGAEVTMEEGLVHSTNLVAIDILKSITPEYAQKFVLNFGFTRKQVPAFYTLALGAGSASMEQLATAYAVFANGGFLVSPYLLTRITDRDGKLIEKFAPPIAPREETRRVITEQNVLMMDQMLRAVATRGTAARARALGRPDVGGKTGTTNDETDAWFSGYMGNVVGVSWLGYDQPRKLGERETGGSLALPIWIDYMQKLRDVPIVTQRANLPDAALISEPSVSVPITSDKPVMPMAKP